MRFAAIAVLVLVGSCFTFSAETSQPLANGSRTTVSDSDLAIQLPIDLVEAGDYAVSIKRQFGSPEEERLLRLAEAAFPIHVDRRARAPAELHLPKQKGLEWSRGGFDDVPIADVVCSRAVRHYWDVCIGYRTNSQFIPGRSFNSTRLAYTAALLRIEHYSHGGDTYRDVYVAELSLSWLQSCGELCGMCFRRVKEVVLNSRGDVLAVYVDHPTNNMMTVS